MLEGLLRIFFLSIVRVFQYYVFYLLTNNFNGQLVFAFVVLILLERFIQDVEIV